MYLSNIKLWNFRKFGSETEISVGSPPNLDLNMKKGLNVIIGENDSGKTAIIDAIKLVLKTHTYDYIKVDDSDFYKNTSHFRIEITFKGLSQEEAKNFTERLAWIGNGNSADPFLRLIYDVKRQGGRIIPSDVNAGVDNEGSPLSAGAKEYLKATYLKPLRDAENELLAKRNSRLSQILLADSAFKGKEKDHELIALFSEMSEELKKYFKGDFEHTVEGEGGVLQTTRPQEGKVIKDKIDGYIKNFYGNESETSFDVAKNDIKGILEKLTLSLRDEPNPGLGTLNRLFMAAELLHLNKSNWSGVRLGLVEELEAHLHPQAQMQVIDSLQRQDSIQLILTTHSPNLASKIKLENLVICSNGNAFPMGPEYTKLDDPDYIYLEKFLDTTKANMFFAKGLILVEGWAEEILIPSIARNIGINLTEKGVSIVNVGSLAFNRYSKIFLRANDPKMAIPVSVVTDSDIRCYERNKNASGEYVYAKRDETTVLGELARKQTDLQSRSEDNVQYFIAPKWTLEYCLFVSTCLSNIFQKAAKATHEDTDWDSDFEMSLAIKLLNKGLGKTEIAYVISNEIDDDLKKVAQGQKANKEIVIDAENENDSINYLIKAIKHASGI